MRIDEEMREHIQRIKGDMVRPSEMQNHELIERFQQGDNSVIDRLVVGNIMLIVKCACRYHFRNNLYDIMDLVDEGVIAMMQAFEGYDASKGSVSTRVVPVIKKQIGEFVYANGESSIGSSWLMRKIGRYNNTQKQCELEGRCLPSDDELCSQLKVSPLILETIKNSEQYKTISLQAKASLEQSELGDFLDSSSNVSDDVIDEITDRELCVFFKEILPPIRYAVLYHRVLSGNKLLQKDLAAMFGVTDRRIQIIERETLKTAGKIMLNREELYEQRLAFLRRKIDMEHYDVMPVDLEKIFLYLFFRDEFTESEKRVFKYLITSKYIYEDDRHAKILGLSLDEFGSVKCSISRKITDGLKIFGSSYGHFKEMLLADYKTKVMKIDLNCPDDELPINYMKLAKRWIAQRSLVSELYERGEERAKEIDKVMVKVFK